MIRITMFLTYLIEIDIFSSARKLNFFLTFLVTIGKKLFPAPNECCVLIRRARTAFEFF